MKYKWLIFEEVENPNKKTKIFNVRHKDGNYLGDIKWHCGWRQYVFWPDEFTFWSKSCLEDITMFIKELMENRK